MVAVVSRSAVIARKYVLERLLGKGGMGTVHAARHIALGELFAIKFLTATDADTKARFLNEAKTAARLTSEHVTRVIDVGIDDEFMTQLADGLPPRSSALFVLVRKATPDRMLEEIRGSGGKILKAPLRHEDAATLQAALSAAMR